MKKRSDVMFRPAVTFRVAIFSVLMLTTCACSGYSIIPPKPGVASAGAIATPVPPPVLPRNGVISATAVDDKGNAKTLTALPRG